MKILCTASRVAKTDGWARTSYELLSHWKSIVDLDVAVQKKTCNEPPAGIQPVAILGDQYWRFIKPVLAARDSLRLKWKFSKPDMVIAMDETTILSSYYYSRLLNIPFGFILYGTYAVRILNPPLRPWYLPAFRHATAIVGISRHTRDLVTQLIPKIDDVSIDVVPLGVEPQMVRVVAEISLESRKNWIISVGGVKARKSQDRVLSALALIEPDIRPKFKIAGVVNENDPYVINLRSAIARLGLKNDVELIGGISDTALLELYDLARILVMPSRNENNHFEGFGLVHLEANARGLPVIGGRGSGNEEAIIDNQTGYLCDPNDIEELSSKIICLLTDDKLWLEMSNNAIKHASHMSWEKAARKMFHCFTKLKY